VHIIASNSAFWAGAPVGCDAPGRGVLVAFGCAVRGLIAFGGMVPMIVGCCGTPVIIKGKTVIASEKEMGESSRYR
jgi:hypothetical protein